MAENVTEKGDLTPRQLEAIRALMTEPDVSKAARAAHISRQTLYRWQHQAHFQAALRQAEGEAVKRLAMQIVGLGDLAVAALRDALQPTETMAHRLRAADIVTARGIELQQLVGMMERLDALEASLGQAANNGHDRT